MAALSLIVTTSDASERGSRESSPRPGVIGAGPVLVLHPAACADCRELVTVATSQFAKHGVEVERSPIEMAMNRDLATFPGIVVVMHSAAEATSSVLASITEMTAEYRRIKEHGLRWLLASEQRKFYDAGVLQFVLPRAVLDHRRLQKALGKVCKPHRLDWPNGSFDLIKPYLGRGLSSVPDGAQWDEQSINPVQDVADYLASWGVTDIRQVPQLRRCIDGWRNDLRSAKHLRVLGGYPIRGIRKTRLEIILFEQGVRFPGLELMTDAQRRRWSKDWNENAARLWRLIHEDLDRIVPGMDRPGRRANTKGAQDDLRKLYAALRETHEFMERTEQQDWPTFGPRPDS